MYSPKPMDKIIKLISIAGISSLISSNIHYLLSAIKGDYLKVLGYGSILIVGVMGIVLDDAFASYFQSETNGVVALVASCFTAIFLFSSYRAFTLNERIEGLILAVLLAAFWLMLLALYLKILLGVKHE